MENIELLSKDIKTAVEKAKMWQRVPTSEPGIFLIKAPVRGEEEHIMIEINPIDVNGHPVKRRGIFISNLNQFKLFKEILNRDKAETVIKAIDYITGEALKQNGDKAVLKI